MDTVLQVLRFMECLLKVSDLPGTRFGLFLRLTLLFGRRG